MFYSIHTIEDDDDESNIVLPACANVDFERGGNHSFRSLLEVKFGTHG